MFKTWDEAIKELGLIELIVTYTISGKRKECSENSFKSIEEFKDYAKMMGYVYSKIHDLTNGVVYYPKLRIG